MANVAQLGYETLSSLEFNDNDTWPAELECRTCYTASDFVTPNKQTSDSAQRLGYDNSCLSHIQTKIQSPKCMSDILFVELVE